jgi:hypothetical protein
MPLIAARAWAPWAVAPRHSEELRVLERRVMAARLGEGSLPRLTRHGLSEGLR